MGKDRAGPNARPLRCPRRSLHSPLESGKPADSHIRLQTRRGPDRSPGLSELGAAAAAAPPALTRGEGAQRSAAGQGEQRAAGPEQQDTHRGHSAQGTTRPAPGAAPGRAIQGTPRPQAGIAQSPASRDRVRIARSVRETGAWPRAGGKGGDEGLGRGRGSGGGSWVGGVTPPPGPAAA